MQKWYNDFNVQTRVDKRIMATLVIGMVKKGERKELKSAGNMIREILAELAEEWREEYEIEEIRVDEAEEVLGEVGFLNEYTTRGTKVQNRRSKERETIEELVKENEQFRRMLEGRRTREDEPQVKESEKLRYLKEELSKEIKKEREPKKLVAGKEFLEKALGIFQHLKTKDDNELKEIRERMATERKENGSNQEKDNFDDWIAEESVEEVLERRKEEDRIKKEVMKGFIPERAKLEEIERYMKKEE